MNYTHHHTQVIYSRKFPKTHLRTTISDKHIFFMWLFCLVFGNQQSTKSDHAIRYHSLHHNAYIRHFPGHTDRVTSLEMSPIEDQFLSCSLDRLEFHSKRLNFEKGKT